MQTDKIPLYTAGGAVYDFDKALVKKYTLPSPFEGEPSISMYREFEEDGERRIMLPRRFCPMGEDRTDPGIAVNFNSSFIPRPGQQEWVDRIVYWLQQGESHVAQASTGFGKTVATLEVVARMGLRALVLVPKEDIIDQWFAAAKMVLGLDRAKGEVGLWRADTCDVIGHKLVIGMIHSVLKGPARYGHAAYQGFGLVIVDETHIVSADTFVQSMWWLPARLKLGISATPNRKDGRDPILFGHIGTVKVTSKVQTMIPRVLLARTGWKVPRTVYKGRVQQIPHKPGKVMHINKILGKDEKRNSIISSFVKAAYRKQRSTIIFSDTMAHLKNLKEALMKEGIPAKDIGYYVGLQFYDGKEGNRKQQRERAKYKPIILATMKMCAMATDIPWLDTCVLATPRSDVIQIVGRIRREYENKKEPVVFDLVDSDSPVFEQYANKRCKWYRSIGSKIEVVR